MFVNYDCYYDYLLASDESASDLALCVIGLTFLIGKLAIYVSADC